MPNILTLLDLFDFDNAMLNKWYHPSLAICLYLVSLKTIETYKCTYKLNAKVKSIAKSVQIINNLAISIFSLCLVLVTSFIMFLIEAGYISVSNVNYIICPTHNESWKGILGSLVYVFYLTKYWELFDTVVQLIKGDRPPSFYFHVWHHIGYLLICWSYCKHQVSLSSASILVNGSVHVIMYYYYYLKTKGNKVYWKSVITKLQILQFIAGYWFLMATLTQKYFYNKDCNGITTLWFHAIFNLTMLIGFINIHRRIKLENNYEINWHNLSHILIKKFGNK